MPKAVMATTKAIMARMNDKINIETTLSSHYGQLGNRAIHK